MKRVSIIVFAAATAVATFSSSIHAADAPADRVIAIYFHRTERCPTCRMMGSYSEEAVRQGFAKQIEEGKVAFHFVDFQNEKNAALAKGYKVSGPTLIVAKISGNEVERYKDLGEIWTRVRDKADFINYVSENVTAYLK